MRIQRSAEHRIVPWANGLGVTADVFLWPPDVDEWTWRLSIADVTDDVPFSAMPGIDRHIVVAQGAGMALTIDGAAEVRMDPATPPVSFDGSSVTTCRLVDGPIADLNLMVRRDSARGALRVVAMRSGESVTSVADDVALVVLDGAITIDGTRLDVFDAASWGNDVAVIARAEAAATVAIASVRER